MFEGILCFKSKLTSCLFLVFSIQPYNFLTADTFGLKKKEDVFVFCDEKKIEPSRPYEQICN